MIKQEQLQVCAAQAEPVSVASTQAHRKTLIPSVDQQLQQCKALD